MNASPKLAKLALKISLLLAEIASKLFFVPFLHRRSDTKL